MRFAAPEGHPVIPPAFAGERFLLAEDEPLITMEVCRFLEQEGATVLPARTVSGALQVVDTRALSAGVVDIRLGDEDADSVCEALSRRQVPFVFYTGRSDTRERWPAAPVIQKPATPEAIVGAVKYVLSADRRDIFCSATLHPDDTKVMSAERRVAEGEERIFRMRCLLTRLQERGFETSAAQELLAIMTKSLDLMRGQRRLMASQEWRTPTG